MLSDQTRTAEASGRGAGHFFALSLRDALRAGELCRVDVVQSTQPSRTWYEFRFRWPPGDKGEAIRVATSARGRLLIAETWLVEAMSDAILFGPQPDLCKGLEDGHSVVALRAFEISEERGAIALALETDTGKQLLIAQQGVTRGRNRLG
jgi:hypothetical protein